MVVGPKPHAHSVFLYWGIFAALCFLTVVTVWVADFDFGSFSALVALSVASLKACLVAAVFMHLWFDSKFYTLILASSLVFLSLFVLFPFLDDNSRAFVVPERENFLPRDEVVEKYKMDNPGALPLRPGLQKPVEADLVFEGPHSQH
jgi:cytochrome c oxidase subunit 4